MANESDKGTRRVLVTSVDGNADHPFRPNQSIGEVREWAYGKLVVDKRETPLENTWIEHRENRVDLNMELGSLDREETQTGREPDIVLSLSWTSQGG